MKVLHYSRPILFLTLFLGSVVVYAQTTKPTATEKAADEICAKFQDVDINNTSAEDIMKRFQEMLVKTFANDMTGLMAEFNITEMNGENGRKIGVEIGKKLLVRCPKFVDISIKLGTTQTEQNDPPTEKTPDYEEGTIVKMGGTDFTTITVKNANGRETPYYWFHYFKGSEKLESVATGGIGKKIKISWTEQEYYLPKVHGYYNIKIIRAIDFLN